ncbi:hypothetical protein OA501_01025 [Flavobacteriaceae bacterium]|nr:hypothetical protein [Flavobacteriaceae bacterium]
MIAMSKSTGLQDGLELFSYGTLINALVWSTPVGLLIWLLKNKKTLCITRVTVVQALKKGI